MLCGLEGKRETLMEIVMLSRTTVLSLTIMAALVGRVTAGDGECKVCQPVTETKKVSKRVYTSVCEDFCLPRCSFLGGLIGHSDCGECKDAKCGPVHAKKYLVVKIRTTEECVTKCVPKPACEPPVIFTLPVPVSTTLPAKP
jgi:hypothetical protein